MKNPVKITLITIGLLFLGYLLIWNFNLLKFYNIPTSANEPGIKLNTVILTSNLKNYQNGDFVCYKYNDELLGEHIRVHRLIGRSKDTIEIRKGVLFLNNKNYDENLELKHYYLLKNKEYRRLYVEKIINEGDLAFQIKNDQTLVSLLDKKAKQNKLGTKIYLKSKEDINENISKTYKQDWNEDNFGPLIIPEGKCFVIGDNRHYSEDSRYIGLINELDIISTVLFK